MRAAPSCRPDLVTIDNPVNPRNYLGKFWVDCITHDFIMLEYILDKVGTDKVALGSEYPFPLGDLTIGEFIEQSGLPEATVEKIFCENTLAWLGLDKEQFV